MQVAGRCSRSSYPSAGVKEEEESKARRGIGRERERARAMHSCADALAYPSIRACSLGRRGESCDIKTRSMFSLATGLHGSSLGKFK